MPREFKVDLHIHTSLSPCGDSAMVPPLLTDQAKVKGLNIIGICDHNATENVEAVKEASRGKGVHVLGGMEVTSSEEVHVLAIFGDDENLKRMQHIVYENLPGKNDVRAFGAQLIVDANGNVVGSNDHLLIGATNLSVREIVEYVHKLGGVAVASHIDKQVFSVTSQLGFIPVNIPFDALEISPHGVLANKGGQMELAGYGKLKEPVVSFSDAHYLEDIGKRFTRFTMEEATFEEIRRAMHDSNGQRIRF
jgi:3',5'-nucleoside bisphosphate phosphatase